MGKAEMNILLDTHVLIWSVEDKNKLGKKAINILVNNSNNLFISPISTLEIAQLLNNKRITFKSSIDVWVEQSIKQLQLVTTPISHEVTVEAYRLSGKFHGDPADRILVSTAKLMNFQLMTADKKILSYEDVYTIDARK